MFRIYPSKTISGNFLHRYGGGGGGEKAGFAAHFGVQDVLMCVMEDWNENCSVTERRLEV